MTSKDLNSVIIPIFGLILIIMTLILIRRYKLKPETWPYIAGLVGGVFLFVPIMIGSIMNRSLTELFYYTISNLIFSFAVSVVIYFSFRMIVTRIVQKKNKKK
jgi:zinc transporter ZupT